MLFYIYGTYLLAGVVMFIFNFPDFGQPSEQSEIEMVKIEK